MSLLALLHIVLCNDVFIGQGHWLMHRSAKFQTPPNAVICFELVKACEGVFLLCFLGQIVT